jgi:hypothetical protein
MRLRTSGGMIYTISLDIFCGEDDRAQGKIKE